MTPGRRSQILLVDDDASTIHLLGRMLAAEGDIRFTTSGPDALGLVHKMAPDVILLDIDMPGKNGLEICRALQNDARLSQVPVIILTSHAQPATEVWALELGAADFIAKPLIGTQVVARVRAQLRSPRWPVQPDEGVAFESAQTNGHPDADGGTQGSPGPARVLIVDDDASAIQCVRLALTSSAAQFQFARSGEEALRLAAATRPDIILLDAQMPGIDGFEVCRRLQADAGLAHIPVVFVTQVDDPDQEARAMDLGACGYISKPYKPSVLNARVRNLLRRRARRPAGLARPAAREAPQPPAVLSSAERSRAPTPPLQAIAQELGDPLHGILGCAQLMLADPEHPLDAVQACRLDRIVDAGRHLQAVMREVSDLSQLDGGTLEMNLQPIDALGCLQEAVRQAQPDSTARGLSVSVSVLPDGLLPVQGDRARLLQCFAHLLALVAKGSLAARRVEFTLEALGSHHLQVVARLRVGAVQAAVDKPTQARRLPASAGDAGRSTELKWCLAWHLVHAMGGRLEAGPPYPIESPLFVLTLPVAGSERPQTRQ
ncbi:MAG: response regulator [Pseudomonadota bacterium]